MNETNQIEVTCYSSGTYNMSGFQIDDNRKIIPNGRIFYGANYILEKENGFEFIVQSLPTDKETKIIQLHAKTQRSARVELNKMFPALRNAYSKPRFVTVDQVNENIKERDQKIASGDHN